MSSVVARRLVVLIVVSLAAAWFLAACGTQEAQLPQVQAQVTVGPGQGEVTIDLASSGDGVGVAEVVLQFPDGHKKVIGNGVLEKDTSVGFTPSELPAGDYRYLVYAVPTASTPPDPSFPENARVEGNVIAQGGFTID